MHTARDFTGRQVQSRSFLAQLPGMQCVQVRAGAHKGHCHAGSRMWAAACGQQHVPHLSWAALLNTPDAGHMA